MSDEGRTIVDGGEISMTKAPVYEKIGRIRAIPMQYPFVVVTLEGLMHGEQDDYLCEAILSDGSPGERWVVKKERFSATYRMSMTAVPLPSEAPCEPGEFGADRDVAKAMRDNPLSVHYQSEVVA